MKTLSLSILSFAALSAGHIASATPPEGGDGYQIVSLPTMAGDGTPVESQVVADTPYVKSVVIKLRNGATLPEHASADAASIQALSGRGRVHLGTRFEELSPARMVLLAPGLKHEVVADKGTDLVLLVQHMKRSRTTAAPAQH